MGRDIAMLLSELEAGLMVMYAGRLKGAYLFGSYARGEADSESDADVLIVLDRISGYGAEVERTGRLISELSLKYGVSVSRTFVSERDWLSGESPFLTNVREEAVPA
ncbi:MAG: nucleotidyltransferase domain-containing protein [Vicinamibacteria bacterium]